MNDEYATNDSIAEHILWVVTEVWIIKDREDLLKDCLDFVSDIIYSLDKPITDMDIMRCICMFLQEHCKDAISSEDLNKMHEDETKH
jgi:hypothetical protein